MKLDKYLESHGARRKLARSIGYSESTISQVAAGKKLPGVKLCEKIEKFTLGNVSKAELRPDIWG